MRHQGLNYAVVGAFVVAMLTAALGAVVTLSGGTTARDSYVVVFDNIADVKFGTQVRYEGYPVGQVEAIRPVVENGATVFRLDVSVEQGFVIPSDSVARVHASQFLAAKTVEIQRGEDVTALQPGDRIVSAPPADMFSAMAGVAGQVSELSQDGLKPLLDRLTVLVDNANSLIDDDVAPMIGSLNAVAQDTRGRVPEITGELLAFMQELNVTLASVQQLLSEHNVAEVQQTVENVNAVSEDLIVISETVQGTLVQLDSIVANLQDVVEKNQGNVNASLDDTRYILRSIAQNIDSVNHNLAGTARNMNEFSRLIRQNPGLLLGGSAPEEVRVESPSARSRTRSEYQ